MLKSTILAELICTRINHDIIGNVGAVANAVELLEEGDTDFLDDIAKILKISSFTMSARLKFFRLAFGLSNATVGSLPELNEVIKNYLKTIGNANYPIELTVELQNLEFYKVVMLLAMLGADIFIKGGTILFAQDGDSLRFECSSKYPVNSERVELIRAVLAGKEVEPTAKLAPIYYLQEILINLHYTLAITSEESLGFMISKEV